MRPYFLAENYRFKLVDRIVIGIGNNIAIIISIAIRSNIGMTLSVQFRTYELAKTVIEHMASIASHYTVDRGMTDIMTVLAVIGTTTETVTDGMMK